MTSTLPRIFAAVSLFAAACGPSGNTEPVCVPGASVTCACANGANGAQMCTDDGSGFEACACTTIGADASVFDAMASVWDAGDASIEPIDSATLDAEAPDGAPETDAAFMDVEDADIDLAIAVDAMIPVDMATSPDASFAMDMTTMPDASIDLAVTPDAIVASDMTVAMDASHVVVPPPEGTLCAAERFDDVSIGNRPDYWEYACPSTGFNIAVNNSDDHRLRIDTTASTGEGVFGFPVSDFDKYTSGTYILRFRARVDRTNQNVYALAARNGRRVFDAIPFNRTGMIGESSKSYEANRWYQFDYAIDFSTSQFAMYVDGDLAQQGPFSNEAVPCPIADGNYFGFHGGYVDQKFVLDIDDVELVAGDGFVCEIPSCTLVSPTIESRMHVTDTTDLFPATFTYETLVKFESLDDTDPGQLFFVAESTSVSYALMYMRAYRDNFECVIGTGTGELRAEYPIDTDWAGEWMHFACTRDGDELALWINGVKVDTNVSSPYVAPSGTLGIIGDYRTPANWASVFVGEVDEMRVSNAVVYTDTFEPQWRAELRDDTVALWHFDECEGTTAYDSATDGDRHTGTLLSGATWGEEP